MRNQSTLLLIVCLSAVALSLACSSMDHSEGTPVTDEVLAGLEEGKTTRDEVIEELGGPQDMRSEGDRELFVYRYRRIKVNPFAKDEDRSVTLVFNADGILVEKLVSQGSGLPNPLTGS